MLIRELHPSDERGWVRCRALAFLPTNYYDDVHPTSALPDEHVLRLVADDDGEVVGLIDVTLEGDAATIDSIAVLPDGQRSGVGTALLEAALARLPEGTVTLDAWTREDVAANAWYRARGFVENDCYLHVYGVDDEIPDPAATPACWCVRTGTRRSNGRPSCGHASSGSTSAGNT